MEQDKLSGPQARALLFGSLLGPAAEFLPGPAAKAGGMGALGVLGAVILLAVVAMAVRDVEGGVLGAVPRVLLPVYIVWLQLLLTLRLIQAAQRMQSMGSRDGAAWFFVAALGGMALWMGRGSLGALGRAAQLLCLALAGTGAAVLLLALPQADSGRLLSGRAWTWFAVLWPGMQVVSYGLFALFLYQPAGKTCLKFSGVLAGTLVAGQLVLLARFGPSLTQELNSPFFQLAKGVGVEGGFQRVESLVAAVWLFGDLLLLAGLLWAMRKLWGRLVSGISGPGVVTISAILAAVVAVAALGVGGRVSLTILEAGVAPVGSLILGGMAPVLVMRKKPRKNGK